MFQVMKGNNPRLLYPAKLSFRREGQIKCFADKVKLKEFIITKCNRVQPRGAPNRDL